MMPEVLVMIHDSSISDDWLTNPPRRLQHLPAGHSHGPCSRWWPWQRRRERQPDDVACPASSYHGLEIAEKPVRNHGLDSWLFMLQQAELQDVPPSGQIVAESSNPRLHLLPQKNEVDSFSFELIYVLYSCSYSMIVLWFPNSEYGWIWH